MKKKWLALLISAALLLSVGSVAVGAEGEEPQLVPDFSDDFESYEAGDWIENTSGFSEKWSNNVLDKAEGLQVDMHLKERAKIVYEEGTSGNKVLYLNNMTGGNSFFYIAPKGDYRYKNFVGSFRVKFLEGNDGWISLNLRKSDSVWYTGCHNLNIVISVEKDKSCIRSYAYRNMPGTSDILLKEDSDQGYTLHYQNYTSDTKQYEGDWFNVRYEVQDSSFKVYLDETLLVDLNYPSRLVSDFGYVSLNGCTTMAYFDDFSIENHDTEAPPVIETEEPQDPEPLPPSGDEEKKDDGGEEPVAGGGCGGSVAGASVLFGAVFAAAAALLFRRKRD